MNREDLFAAITEIKDEYIEEADPGRAVPASQRHRLRTYLSLAAALAVVVGLVAMAGKLTLPQTKEAAFDEACVEEAAPAAAEPVLAAQSDEAAGEAQKGESKEWPAEEPASDIPEVAEEAEAGERVDELDEAPKTENESVDQEGIQRPEKILWNGTEYYSTGEILYESPAGFEDAGMLSAEADAEFYADDLGSSGYSVYTSEEDTERVYLAVPEGFLCYVTK